MIESVLSSLFTLENLLWINVGLAGGIMVGALPGLTGTMAMALLLPLTYGLASIPGVMLLLGVYCGRYLRRFHHRHPDQHAGHAGLGCHLAGRLPDGSEGARVKSSA